MSKHKERPNIIVILTDDQGAWAMGCAGNPDVKTPNIDRLAASGVRFSNFFCTSPVCSPARASLLTGKMPSQHGIHDWLDTKTKSETEIEFLDGHIGYTDILADNGYVCGLSGKWHMGHSGKPQKGFSHWYAHEKGGGPYYGAPMIKHGERVEEEGYITDLITDDGLAFIEKQAKADAPFYLNVNYTAPHSPWINQHPQEYVDMYDESILDAHPKNPEHPWSTTNVSDNHFENLQGYFASITAMDANVGRIIDKVESLGLRENTLICFLSDNGLNFGQHGIWGKGNGTFPQNMFDTSVKVPAIMSHPGYIQENKVSDSLISGYDFKPTLLDYVGLKSNEDLPGQSFLSELKHGVNTDRRDHVVIFDEYGPVRMIRTRDWKYIHRYPYGPHELYHLAEDPGEERNVVDEPKHHEIQEELKGDLDAWFVKHSDPELDGSREAVTGAGQRGRAGIKGKGKDVYSKWPKK